MNTSHYPSLSLCKKLTEIGFPETEKIYSRPVGGYVSGPRAGEKFDFQIKRRVLPGELTTSDCKEEYLCPSVMEMLDVIPKCLRYKPNATTTLFIEGWLTEGEGPYLVGYTKQKYFKDKSLPNALAEMILWLVENGYINFNAS